MTKALESRTTTTQLCLIWSLINSKDHSLFFSVNFHIYCSVAREVEAFDMKPYFSSIKERLCLKSRKKVQNRKMTFKKLT